MRGDIDINGLKYFDVGEAKFVRFYLLPKIRERLHSVPGRPVICNSGFYTENIYGFLGFHFKPIAAKGYINDVSSRILSSYIKDTSDFLRKLQNLPKLPDDLILCTIDIVGLYFNIPITRVCYSLKAIR